MIRFDDVVVELDGRRILDRITLDLADQRVGVIGANGGGKSTLARLVNGLVLASSGRVKVNGLDVATQARAVRRQVGFLFSDPDAQIIMPTVGEDVGFSLRRRGLTSDQRAGLIQQSLARVGLNDLVDRPAHLLSSGQKQLLALASVLASEPQVLVADEPTTLLDLRNTVLLTRVLESLPQQVMLVTHDLSLVAGWPRVVCVADGRVVDDGPGEQVTAAYRRRMLDGVDAGPS
ncbi:MAG: energy-coupling factor ABC transporter ATP-binding protein [Actinomycetales bacterium]